MKLVLFDIDGTLVNTGGAGYRALSRAIGSFVGVDDGLSGMSLDGKTDQLIVKEAFDLLGVEFESEFDAQTHIFEAYLVNLDEELERGKAKYRVLPGVRELVVHLSGDTDFILGLATGNIEAGARLKLENAGLNPFFRFGGFGSDSENRTELIRAGIRRGLARLREDDFESVYVVGDTIRDIVHGHEAGARVVAVATGSYSVEELKTNDPDLVVPDLTHSEEVLGFLLSE
jgi:phosphoglycolate phosphatase-like HAD superfamily hydrolase